MTFIPNALIAQNQLMIRVQTTWESRHSAIG